MPLRKIRPALVLLVLVPGLAQSQTSLTPPPPGPYQAVPEMPPVPGQLQTPQAPAEQGGRAQGMQPSATQIWGPPPVMQLPYWMQAPVGMQPVGAQQMSTRQSGTSPVAVPDARGGGQAEQMQLSPAGQTTAPQNFSGGGFQPGFGTGVTPGSFPGYAVQPGQTGAGNPGEPAGQARGAATTGQSGGQAPAYGTMAYPGYPQGYQAYPGYPGYPAFTPYPGQMPVPYWAMPAPYGYGYGGQPQANR